MKISEARVAFYAASGTASTLARPIAFAGIAIVWLYSAKTAQGYSLPKDFLVVLLLFVFTLLFDLLHYVVQAAIWGIWARLKERAAHNAEAGDDADFDASAYLNWPVNVFYFGKFLALIIGYILLAKFLGHAVVFS